VTNIRVCVLAAVTIAGGWPLIGTAGSPMAQAQSTASALDRDLIEVTVPKLEAMYASKRHTVTEVTRWYLERIARYDAVYRAVWHVDLDGALATAATEDATAARHAEGFSRGPLWGVPVVIKANTSIKGLVTDGRATSFLAMSCLRRLTQRSSHTFARRAR
jgi:amidase